MDALRSRGVIILFLMGAVMLTYMGRLFSIQVMSDEFEAQARKTVVQVRRILPPRGNVYDRNSSIYVSNRPTFTMMVTKSELHIPPQDTMLLCKLLGIAPAEIRKRLGQIPVDWSRKPYEFARHIEPEVYGRLQEQMWDFRGISFTATTQRYYSQPIGGNILGYIGEVSRKELESNPERFKLGDLVGRTGIERSHDTILRGAQGERRVLVDRWVREVGPYAEGEFDQPATKGRDIMLGINMDLQAFGEELMQGKKGSIVAIQPSSGDILAFISAPSYNPSLLTGKDLGKNWRALRQDSLKPLFNRPLMASYPPGSIFKVAVALAALNEGTITPETYYYCGGGFIRNKGKPGCRFHPSIKLPTAIQVSCNSYFAATYVDFIHHPKFENHFEGYKRWTEYMNEMGMGGELGVDMPYESTGLIPSRERYDRIYKGRWMGMTTISNAIGQGEILMTPVQMANLAAVIANRGYYYPPHFLRAVQSNGEDRDWDNVPYQPRRTSIARRHYETVIDAMASVVSQGTARRAYLSDIPIAGKTGTVQNPHGQDHAVFIGFAPVDNPQIAIAVIVENAGGGGSWAAPTASLMIEKALRGEIKEKQFEYNRIIKARFIP